MLIFCDECAESNVIRWHLHAFALQEQAGKCLSPTTSSLVGCETVSALLVS